MRYIILAAMAFASFGFGDTSGSGYVTPASTTITFTRASLVKVDNSQVQILDGSFTHEFKKTDTDFASVNLTDIMVPEGRYAGVSICYNTDRTVKLDGDKYVGADGAVIHNGDTLYTKTAASALTNGSVVTASPSGGAVALTGFVIGNGTNNCSSSTFANPVCVASSTDHCEAADTKIDVNTTLPNLNLLLDMYNSVAVDASNASLDNHTPIYPYPTLGAAGAAMHLSKASAGGVANVSLLFDTNKKLLFSSSYGQSASNSGFCSGVGAVNVTTAPTGSFVNGYGPTFVQTYTDASGKVEFATGNCGTGSTCTSNGLLTLDNVKQAVDSDVNVTCPADTTGALGFAYTGGAGITGTSTIKVNRVMDPGNVFGVCTTNGGVCGVYQ